MPSDEASRIAEALEATKQLVSELDRRARMTEGILTEIKADLRQVSETATKLSTLIWTGNGSESLLTRLALIERQVAAHENTIKEQRDAQVKFKAALVTSLIGLAATLGAALIALFR